MSNNTNWPKDQNVIMPAGISLYGCPPESPRTPQVPDITTPDPQDIFRKIATKDPILVVCAGCNRHFVAGTLCPWCTPRREDTTESKALRDALGVAMANLLEIQTDLAKERENLDEIQRVVDEALEKVKKALK